MQQIDKKSESYPKITKEEVLAKTNEGLDFFQFVFTNLQVRGNKAFFGHNKLGKNPFYQDNKASLSIFFKNNHWQFHDFGDDIYKGDIFDLAGFYYGLDASKHFVEILKRIDQDLCLGLGADTQTQQTNSSVKTKPKPEIKPITSEPNYHDFSLIEEASKSIFYQKNVFISYFLDFFEQDKKAYEVLQRYYVGTSQKGTCFPQINAEGKCTFVKIQPYKIQTKSEQGYTWQDCNRTDYMTNLHSVLQLTNFNYKQCLFGEHLTKQSNSKIAVVESAKNALFGAMYFPQFVWVSTEGASNFLLIKNLVGKHLILFPDNDKWSEWTSKAKEIENYVASVQVSQFLIKHQQDLPLSMAKKADLADFFIFAKYCLGVSYKDFIPQKEGKTIEIKTGTDFIRNEAYLNSLFFDEQGRLMTETSTESYPANWDTTAPYISQKAKDFIRLAENYPTILWLKDRLGLEIIEQSQGI